MGVGVGAFIGTTAMAFPHEDAFKARSAGDAKQGVPLSSISPALPIRETLSPDCITTSYPPFKSPVEKRFSKNRALRGRHGAVAMYFTILLCVSRCYERLAKFNVSLLKNHLGHINASSGKLHCCGTLHILVINKIISSHSVRR
jgi:hypothetical protein